MAAALLAMILAMHCGAAVAAGAGIRSVGVWPGFWQPGFRSVLAYTLSGVVVGAEYVAANADGDGEVPSRSHSVDNWTPDNVEEWVCARVCANGRM